MTASSTLTIQELSGKPGSFGRVLLLAGAGLPLMGAEWGITNGLVTTWYPGNPDEASQQVLTNKLLPSTWTGNWSRTMLGRAGCKFTDENGDENAVVSPSKLRDIMDSIASSGRRLRVTWTVQGEGPGQSGSIVREGRVASAKFPHDRWDDIGWSVEFHWVSRGGSQTRPVSTRDDNLLASIAGMNAAVANLASSVESKIRSSNKDVRNSATNFSLGQLESLVDYPNKLMTSLTRSVLRITTQLKQVGDIAKKVKNLPFSLANTAVASAQNTVAIVNQFTDEISRQSPEQLSYKSSAADVLRAFTYVGSVTDAAAIAARRSQDLDENFRAFVAKGSNSDRPNVRDTSSTSGNDMLTLHVVRDGDTATGISMKYYGSPDHVIDILKANRLPWHTTSFTRGRGLVIPRLATTVGGV